MELETKCSQYEKALLLATEDPAVTNSVQAYDFVMSHLGVDKSQRPAIRRVKGSLVKKLEHKIEVLK